MILRFLILSILFFTVVESFATKVIPIGGARCENREISVNKDQLSCLKSLDAVQAIRRHFGDILVLKKTCPRCKTFMINESEFQSLYSSPFLVISAAYATQGSGVEVSIIFKERPTQAFTLLLEYLVDAGIYQIRVMDADDPSKKISELIKKVQKVEFADFWIEKI